jgi:hypothetical protein
MKKFKSVFGDILVLFTTWFMALVLKNDKEKRENAWEGIKKLTAKKVLTFLLAILIAFLVVALILEKL